MLEVASSAKQLGGAAQGSRGSALSMPESALWLWRPFFFLWGPGPRGEDNKQRKRTLVHPTLTFDLVVYTGSSSVRPRSAAPYPLYRGTGTSCQAPGCAVLGLFVGWIHLIGSYSNYKFGSHSRFFLCYIGSHISGHIAHKMVVKV